MTTEEVCAEVVGRVERTICRGCGAVDIEYDRSGIGHAFADSPPDQCGPVETVEEDQLCGHSESEHHPRSKTGLPHCRSCCLPRYSRPALPCVHEYRAPGAAL